MRRQITKHLNGAAANATPIPPSADRRDRVRGRVHVGKARGRRPFMSQTTPYILA